MIPHIFHGVRVSWSEGGMGRHPSELLGDIRQEFRGAVLGDGRLSKRLERIVERVSVAPADSIPTLLPSDAEREAFYRFVGNEAVGWQDVLEPHLRATAQRCAGAGLVRVVHDTTDFVFSGDREGLGPVMKDTRGFFLHAAFAVAEGEERAPLGVIGALPYVRGAQQMLKSLNERKHQVRSTPRAQKESSRWEALAQEVSARLGSREVIHVMDQEADDFAAMAALVQGGLRFVIRGSSQRLLVPKHGPSVQQQLSASEGELFRTVPLSKREGGGPKQRQAHPARQQREAQLRIRFAPLMLHKPQHAQCEVPHLTLHVVQVFEPSPPEGEEPIAWTLFTTEVVESAQAAARVVDHYRARWLAEEFFKALKTGCALQKRQLQSLQALLITLALFLPIAWRLLVLRLLGRTEAAAPATTLFAHHELQALRALASHKSGHRLSHAPSIREAMLAIAAVGGHIKANGDPGWLVLGRGFEQFLLAVTVWRAARQM
jgi:hypothetical protein